MLTGWDQELILSEVDIDWSKKNWLIKKEGFNRLIKSYQVKLGIDRSGKIWQLQKVGIDRLQKNWLIKKVGIDRTRNSWLIHKVGIDRSQKNLQLQKYFQNVDTFLKSQSWSNNGLTLSRPPCLTTQKRFCLTGI